MKISIGVPTSHEGPYLPTSFVGPEEIVQVTQLAERLGFYAAWALDMMTPINIGLTEPGEPPNWYEAMVSLSYLAAATKTIKLGTATMVLLHRDPVLLAKQVATLDVFSKGRLLLGVGLGHYREEFEAIMPRQRKSHRGRMFLESLEALDVLLTQDDASFKGEYYEFQGVFLNPKPVQNPLPIYISGKTDDTPRRVARYGAGWLLSRMQKRTVQERIEELPPYLEEAGRKRSDIDIVVTRGLSIGKTHEEAMERFYSSILPRQMDVYATRAGIEGRPSEDRALDQNLIGTPQEIGEQMHRIKEYGVDHLVIFYFAVNEFKEMMEQTQWFGEEVMPLFK